MMNPKKKNPSASKRADTEIPPPKKSAIRKESLGKMAVFLLPSLQLKRRGPKGALYEDILHKFLISRFGGYTASAGNIFGYWTDERTGREYYGEHKEYKVSFRGKERTNMLLQFLSRLAGRLGEDCIYVEIGEDAWLVYAAQTKRNHSLASPPPLSRRGNPPA
jgi:hypothetical protein